MNKPLLLSLATITFLGTTLHAQSMYDKFQTLEAEVDSLKKEISTLKGEKKSLNKTVSKESQVQKKQKADEEEPEDDEEENEEEKAQTDTKKVKADKIAQNTEDDEEVQESDESDESEKPEKAEDAQENEETDDESMDVAAEIEEIKETLTELNKSTSGNHLKFGIDYRFALENIQYKMANGDEANNDAFMTSRLWINMDWSANDNLSFTGQLGYNKAFGQRSGASNPSDASLESFDWVANENAYDDTIRVRSAYFLYRNDTFFETKVPWTFSIGRRPSTNGHLINLRDDDMAASPMGHTINVEFDGLSSKFSFDNWVNGMYIKFCAGRGMSHAAPKFTSTPYSTDNKANPDIDLVGFIVAPFDNGQYSLGTQYYYANNLIDALNPMDYTAGFNTVGGLHSTTLNFRSNGIGHEISDFLDDTTFFVSGAWSVTNPNEGESMLGGKVGERLHGYSAWAGLQFPSLATDDGRWGLEYNYGSQYWRSITYGEDTNIGSKMATRGNAYEAYFTEYLVDDILSLQIRYTYIDYDYSGSNGFFGSTTGAAMKISDIPATSPMAAGVVDTAQDIRFYLRYKY